MSEWKAYLPGETEPVRLVDYADFVTGAALNRGAAAAQLPDYFLFDDPKESYHTEVGSS